MNESRKSLISNLSADLTIIYAALQALHEAEDKCDDWDENAVGRIYFASNHVFSAITCLEEIL